MNFEQKVRKMSAHDIIMAMVNGLKNPAINVRMATYGSCRDGVCYGCAATITVMKIADVVFNETNIFQSKHFEAVSSSEDFLDGFESAINGLRIGNIYSYNSIARRYKFATIKNTHIPIFRKRLTLPLLRDDSYMDYLPIYEELAKRQNNWL